MLFSSLPFLVVFLPLVITGVVLLQRVGTARSVMLFLIAASLVFYSWTYPPYLLLLLASIGINFCIGQRLGAVRSGTMLWIGIATNLGLLGWFKYAGFLAGTVSALTGTTLGVGQILLPLAISFFTFQQIGYLVDIYRRTIKPANLLHYTFFISFFPQLIAGPIVHFRELGPQLTKPAFARFFSSDVIAGTLLFALGLAKKVLLADQFRYGADRIFEATALGIEPSLAEAWTGMLCYSFQIYFDFSGYSDMALGLGRIFGLKFPVNFFSPYKSDSIIEFWRRWNITLSHFLRDYLYFPLGGNRNGPVSRYANLFVVMLLGGLWHGASWTFVVWGALHGAYLSVNHFWRFVGGRALPRGLAIGLTFVAAMVAWVFFRADSFDDAAIILSAMVGLSDAQAFATALFTGLDSLVWLLAVGALLVWATPNSIEIVARFEEDGFSFWGARVAVASIAALAALSIFNVYSAGTYEFLYFQF